MLPAGASGLPAVWSFTSRLWSVRVCGGFVRPCCLVALGAGFGRPAFAAVSFVLVDGARSALVLVGPRGGGFVCLDVGSLKAERHLV